ncbi:hypothetical protein [Ottowia thiooxydans]|uniref:Chromosome partitioning protein ParB n=1 Tax=Ottowia thiooxydans TaxID=219182 RepID=A0ABV2Q415_9BURK
MSELESSGSEHLIPGLRRQYHFRPGSSGLRAWDVHKLIRLAQEQNLPLLEVPLSEIRELDEPYWFEHEGTPPTPRAIVEHIKLMDGCQLDWPIILSSDGRLMDGMHRVAQALREGRTHIQAVRFLEDPAPHYVGVAPEHLPY